MLPSTALILPAAKTLWEVWKGTRSGTAEWRGPAESPARATLESGAVVIGLPGRACRTFAFTVPTNDPTLFRQLAFAQLERDRIDRGKAAKLLGQPLDFKHALQGANAWPFGNGMTGSTVRIALGHAMLVRPLTNCITTGVARAFWPAIGCPGGLNFTP